MIVVLSVVAHGVTAEPLASRYGAWVTRERPSMELLDAVEPQVREPWRRPPWQNPRARTTGPCLVDHPDLELSALDVAPMSEFVTNSGELNRNSSDGFSGNW